MAAGVGFDDSTAPWGTKWAGLGAGKGGGQVGPFCMSIDPDCVDSCTTCRSGLVQQFQDSVYFVCAGDDSEH